MRVPAFAFLAPLLLVAFQDPVRDPAAALAAGAPKFEDLELRYAARLFGEDEVEIGGETRLLVLPGKGIRSDASILSFRTSGRDFPDLEFDATSVERGEDLYFWATVHRAPPILYRVLPPGLSIKARRGDYPATLDLFPADFPFRWVADEGLPLFAAAPRTAFDREPAWRPGKGFLELRITEPLIPKRSIARVMPVSSPVKRLYLDPGTNRPIRLEFEMAVERSAVRIVSRVTAWKEVAGGTVPARIETAYEQMSGTDWRDTGLRIVRTLTSARVNRGLKDGDLLPEARRTDVHTDALMNPAAFYLEAARRAPRDPAPLAQLAIARYREAVVHAMEVGREPKIDPVEVIPDYERVLRLAPTSPFVVLSLLRLYEAAGKSAETETLVKALEGHPVKSADVRLALADHWTARGDGARALAHLERVPFDKESPLRLRLKAGRLTVRAMALKDRTADAARVLTGLLADAAGDERKILIDAFAPLPLRRRGPAPEPDPRFDSVLKAAVQASPAAADLRQLELRRGYLMQDLDAFASALAGWMDAGARNQDLEDAAGLALRLRRENTGAAPALEELTSRMIEALPKSTSAWTLRALALADSGRTKAASAACGRLLDVMESSPLTDATVRTRAESLRFVSDRFGGEGEEELLRRSALLFVACFNRAPRPYRLVTGGQRDPISACIAAYLAKSRHVEAFEILKEVDVAKIAYLYGLRPVLRPHESEFYPAVRKHLEASSKDPEDYRRLARLMLRTRPRAGEAIDLMEKAHALAPDDVGIAREFAGMCEGTGGRPERAIELYEALLARHAKDPGTPVDPNLLSYRIGRLHHVAGRKEQAVASLDRVDLGSVGVRSSLTTIAKIYEEAGSDERAIEAYRRFLADSGISYRLASSGVFAHLGKLHEKRKEYAEAYRIYTRGIEAFRKVKERYGPTAIPRPPRTSGENREERDPSRLRDALVKRVGQDYFIDRLLARKGGEPAPAERKKVEELLERLRSDSIVERDDALAELEGVGPRAAPLLKDALKSTDLEFRARLRHLLWKWAEPKPEGE